MIWRATASSGAPPKAVGGKNIFHVYILKSKIKDRFYIGQTRNLVERLNFHNLGKVKSTKPYKPWAIVYKEGFDNRNDAYRRERQIKSYKKGEAFKRLIDN